MKGDAPSSCIRRMSFSQHQLITIHEHVGFVFADAALAAVDICSVGRLVGEDPATCSLIMGNHRMQRRDHRVVDPEGAVHSSSDGDCAFSGDRGAPTWVDRSRQIRQRRRRQSWALGSAASRLLHQLQWPAWTRPSCGPTTDRRLARAVWVCAARNASQLQTHHREYIIGNSGRDAEDESEGAALGCRSMVWASDHVQRYNDDWQQVLDDE